MAPESFAWFPEDVNRFNFFADVCSKPFPAFSLNQGRQIAEICIPSRSPLVAAEEVLVPGQGECPIQVLIVVPGTDEFLAFGPEVADLAQSCLRSMLPVIFCEMFFIEVMVGQKMDFFFWSEMNLWMPFQQ